MKFFSNKTILFIILLVAITTRFYHFTEIPFTHDEFSALFRTDFDTFSELIDQGVRNDGHPAGIQVFLFYWTKMVGQAPWLVKLPFLIFGILSVLLIFLIGRKWYNATVALLSAAFMAILQYPVMYSQIARPYISGLFFTLAMVWFWTLIIKKPGMSFWKNALGLIIASTLCAYNHHFSLLMAGIVWATGLLLIKRALLVKYIIAGAIVILLYLPHLGIFLHQLSLGGIEGWLSKPDNDFILKYLGYIFHFSLMLTGITVFIVLIPLLSGKFNLKFNYKFWLFTAWFLLPLVIGFLYSRYINAVIQYSVLIFSFPFLFFAIFGHIKNQKKWINGALVALILISGLYTLIEKRKHYEVFYNNAHEHIVIDNPNAGNTENKTLAIIHADKEINKYYENKYGYDLDYVRYNDFNTQGAFISFLKKQSHKYKQVYFGGLSSSSAIIIPIIQSYFPKVLWHNTYHGGDTYLFSQETGADRNVIATMTFDKKEKYGWKGIKKKGMTRATDDSTNSVYHMKPDMEWGPGYTLLLDTVLTNQNNFIDATIQFNSKTKPNEMLFVLNVKDGDETIFWKARPFEQFITNNDSMQWYTAFHSAKLSDIRLNGGELHVRFSIWNKGKNDIWLDNFKVSYRTGNPRIYGLIEPI